MRAVVRLSCRRVMDSKWIEEKDFPAKKMDGVWEADAEMIIA
jgi:hypothetical protein